MQPLQAGALPAAACGGAVHEFETCTVRAEQLPHGGFQFAVADEHHGMSECLSGEGETDAEGAGG